MSFPELSGRLPEWGRLFDEASYGVFMDAVKAGLEGRGETFELHEDWARIGGWELPLLPLAQACARVPQAEWPAIIRAELERRAAEEKLGRELDAVRGDFSRARPALKLRVQRADALGLNPVSAPIAGGLHAVLVLDLPSFVTPVRPADLAAWEQPADKLVRLALENVKAQEQIEVKPLEIAGARVFTVAGKSVFVATLGLAADDLLGPPSEHGALLAMPSAHILLCHSIADRRCLKVLEALAAGALQAYEGGPAPLSPDLFWKRGDRFVALPVQRENGKITCGLTREFEEQVVAKLG
jgi:hypothetical protein